MKHFVFIFLLVLSACASTPQISRRIASLPPPVAGRTQFALWQGNKVFYEEFGHGSEDAIIFVHGWTCDGTFWDYQIPEFTARQRVIRIDLPGHGKSEKPTTIKYTMDQFASSVVAVLENAGVKKAVLVGHSLGGVVVRQVYRLAPDKVAALVIADSSLGPWSTETSQAFDQELKELSSPGYKKVASEMINTMFIPESPEAFRQQIKQKMLSTPKHVLVNALRGMNNFSLYKTDPIKVPTLVFRVKYPYIEPDNEKFLRSFITNLSYQEWSDTGHFLMMENPEKFNQELLKFLLKAKI